MSNITKTLTEIKNTHVDTYPEECEIIDLIITSLDYNIISGKELDNGYFCFGINAKEYEVCFFRNPDKHAHPKAERGIAASDFVIALFQKINTEYTCFIVPSDIKAPSAESIKHNLLPNNVEINGKITDTAKGKNEKYIPNHSFFEIDLSIIANYNQHCSRINDSIVVEMKQSGDKTLLEYNRNTANHTPPKAVIQIDPKDEETSRQKASEVLNKIFYHGANANQDSTLEKHKILQTLANDPESEFSRFLQGCNNEYTGRIIVQPSSIYVNAINQKTYTYKCLLPTDRSANLDIVWDMASDIITPDTKLYIMVDENGLFKGLSSRNNESNSLPRFEFNKDIIVPFYSASQYQFKNYSKGQFTVLPKDQTNIQHYKGIKNDIVFIEDTSKDSGFISNAYYVSKDVQKVNNVNRLKKDRLKKDCSECAYDGSLTWNGDLSFTDVSFLDINGKISDGRIKYECMQYKDKRVCPCCNKTMFYADHKRFISYLSKHSLHKSSGITWCCDSCMALCDTPTVITLNRKKHRLITTETGEMILAKLDDSNSILSIDNGGNVYQCSCCNKYVAFDKEKTVWRCNYCQKPVCSACRLSPSNKLLNGEYCCADCQTLPKITVGSSDYRCTDAISSILSGHGKIMAKLDKDGTFLPLEKGGNVYICGNCSQIIYYGDHATDKDFFCEICETRICMACSNKKNTSKDKTRKVYYPELKKFIYACSSCPPTNEPFLKDQKVIYEVNDIPEKVKTYYIDSIDPERLYHCSECEELAIYDINATKNCACCGRKIGPSCYKNIAEDPTLQVKLCKHCREKTSNPTYLTKLHDLEKERAQLIESKKDLYSLELLAKQKSKAFPKEVLSDIRTYLPYFGYKDQKAIKKLIKKAKWSSEIGSLLAEAKVLSHPLIIVYINNIAVFSESEYYIDFDIKVNHTYYRFVNKSGKIAYGGHN